MSDVRRLKSYARPALDVDLATVRGGTVWTWMRVACLNRASDGLLSFLRCRRIN